MNSPSNPTLRLTHDGARQVRAKARVLPANKERKVLILENTGPGAMAIFTTRRGGGKGVRVPMGGTLEFGFEGEPYQGEVWFHASSRKAPVVIHFIEYEARKGERLPV